MVQLQWMWWQVSWVWWHEYTGCDVLAWCDIIKSGRNVMCSSYDVIYLVAVLSYIQWGLYDRWSGCDDRDTVDVLSDIISVRWNIIALMSWVELRCHKSWVRCHIQCILCHIYSRCYVINRVCVISSIQWVWSHRHRHEVCDVIYSGCIVLTQCFMSNIVDIHSQT